MSIPVITFFNNKGGVGKTSLVYHLAWMFSFLGRRVLLADLDPQANLTAAFLSDERLEEIWNDPPNTIFGALSPLLKGTGDIHIPKIIYPDTGELFPNPLGILCGDLALSSFEDQLSETWAKCLDRDERAFRVTSAFWRIIQSAGTSHQADLILTDLGPNLGAINRSALLAADYVVIPLAPDLFSMRGLINLGPTLSNWREGWLDRLSRSPAASDLSLPPGKMQPLGYVVMQPSMRLDRPVRAYEKWIKRIPQVYNEQFGISEQANPDNTPNQLAIIKHYHSLIPLAQEARKPVFHLKPADGAIGSHVQNVRSAHEDFEKLAQKIINLINI